MTSEWQSFDFDAGAIAAGEPTRLALMVGAVGQRTVEVDDFSLEERIP